jgi:hypothetical protein
MKIKHSGGKFDTDGYLVIIIDFLLHKLHDDWTFTYTLIV